MAFMQTQMMQMAAMMAGMQDPDKKGTYEGS